MSSDETMNSGSSSSRNGPRIVDIKVDPVKKGVSIVGFLRPGFAPHRKRSTCGEDKSYRNFSGNFAKFRCEDLKCPKCWKFIVWQRSEGVVEKLITLKKKYGGYLVHLVISPPAGLLDPKLAIAMIRKFLRWKKNPAVFGRLRGYCWVHWEGSQIRIHMVALMSDSIGFLYSGVPAFEANTGWAVVHEPHYPKYPRQKPRIPWIPDAKNLLALVQYIAEEAIIGVVDVDGELLSYRQAIGRIGLRGATTKEERRRNRIRHRKYRLRPQKSFANQGTVPRLANTVPDSSDRPLEVESGVRSFDRSIRTEHGLF